MEEGEAEEAMTAANGFLRTGHAVFLGSEGPDLLTRIEEAIVVGKSGTVFAVEFGTGRTLIFQSSRLEMHSARATGSILEKVKWRRALSVKRQNALCDYSEAAFIKADVSKEPSVCTVSALAAGILERQSNDAV